MTIWRTARAFTTRARSSLIGLSEFSLYLFPFLGKLGLEWEFLSADSFDSYVKRYSYFGAFRSSVSNVGPNAAFLTQDGKLTDIGSWYLGGTATGKVPHGAAGRTTISVGASLVVALVGIWSIL